MYFSTTAVGDGPVVRSWDKQTPRRDLDCDDINVISVRHSLCHVTEMIHIVQATSSTTPIHILSQKATPSTKLTLFRDRDICGGCSTGSKFAHSLFNLEHIRPEWPDPSYQVALPLIISSTI